MTRIERRETRLHRIRARLQRPIKVKTTNATGSKVLKARYHIGESENVYKHIGTFLQNNAGDPAMKVSSIYPYIQFVVCSQNAYRIIYQS